MAESKESGMAMAEINAVLKLNRNKNRIDITINDPINKSTLNPFMEASIKFAGLNKSGVRMTCSFRSIGLILSRATSICLVSL